MTIPNMPVPFDEEYKPLVKKYMRLMPALYAYRMVALANRAVAMAQGSPMDGPPPSVSLRVAGSLIKAAILQLFNVNNNMAGYLNYVLYNKSKDPSVRFLTETMNIHGDPEQLKEHMNIGGYARQMLQNFLDAVVGDDKEHRIIATKGCWPLVLDLADKRKIKWTQTDRKELKFSDYKDIIEREPIDGTYIFYLCDPNNPLDYKYSKDEIKQFMREMHEFCKKTGKKAIIFADNAYWGWCRREYIEDHGFPSFTSVADELFEGEGLSIHNQLVEIFSLGKALGLAASGGSIGLHKGNMHLNGEDQEESIWSELAVSAHKDQTSYFSLPGYPQLAYITESLNYFLKRPEYVLRRSDKIHQHVKKAHEILETYFKTDPAIKVQSYGEAGPYITLKLDDSLLNQYVSIQGKHFFIETVEDVCTYLLEEHGVGLTPLDQRDLPGCIRIFVDLKQKDFNKGIERIVTGLKALGDQTNNPYKDINFELNAA